MDGFKWPSGTKERAAALLERIQRGRLAPEAGRVAWATTPVVPATLPLLTRKDLQTRFGTNSKRRCRQRPEGAWSGPIPSRYGYHLVWVHERQEAFVPPLAEIRRQVDQRFLQKLADEWLALRLQQLRAEFDIVVPAAGR